MISHIFDESYATTYTLLVFCQMKENSRKIPEKEITVDF